MKIIHTALLDTNLGTSENKAACCSIKDKKQILRWPPEASLL